MKKYIISSSQGGLSNRIKCLLSCMKISEKYNKELLLYWPKDSACNCNFNDLFENKIKQISKEEIINLFKKNKKNTLLYKDATFKIFSDKKIYLKFNKIPEESKKEIMDYLSKLKIKKDILKKVEDFSKKFSKDIIGVHIRGGDFKILKSGMGNVSKKQDFIKQMEEEIKKNPKIKFFLSSEDKNIEIELKKIFKSKVITYPKKTNSRENEGSVKEAFIEMLLLSKTKKIIGTFGSTFNEMVWFFGNCKPEVKIIIDKESLNTYLKESNKKNKAFHKIKIFLYNLLVPKTKRVFRVGVK